MRLTKYGLELTTAEETDHYKTLPGFFDDPHGFVEAAIADVREAHGAIANRAQPARKYRSAMLRLASRFQN